MHSRFCAIAISASIALGFLGLLPQPEPSCCEASSPAEATCTGSSSCRACTNCKRCGHCKGGGSCGVCAKPTPTANNATKGKPTSGVRAPNRAKVRLVRRIATEPIYAAKDTVILAVCQSALSRGDTQTVRELEKRGAVWSLSEGELGVVIEVAEAARKVRLDDPLETTWTVWLKEANLTELNSEEEEAALRKKLDRARREIEIADQKEKEAEVAKTIESARELEQPNPLAALRAYRQVIAMLPESDEAKEASEQIKLIEQELAHKAAEEAKALVKRATEEKAERLLSIAKKLEQVGKAEAALRIYKEIVKDFPKTLAAKEAAERIKALEAATPISLMSASAVWST